LPEYIPSLTLLSHINTHTHTGAAFLRALSFGRVLMGGDAGHSVGAHQSRCAVFVSLYMRLVSYVSLCRSQGLCDTCALFECSDARCAEMFVLRVV
jgi:hypothetical protein